MAQLDDDTWLDLMKEFLIVVATFSFISFIFHFVGEIVEDLFG